MKVSHLLQVKEQEFSCFDKLETLQGCQLEHEILGFESIDNYHALQVVLLSN